MHGGGKGKHVVCKGFAMWVLVGGGLYALRIVPAEEGWLVGLAAAVAFWLIEAVALWMKKIKMMKSCKQASAGKRCGCGKKKCGCGRPRPSTSGGALGMGGHGAGCRCPRCKKLSGYGEILPVVGGAGIPSSAY